MQLPNLCLQKVVHQFQKILISLRIMALSYSLPALSSIFCAASASCTLVSNFKRKTRWGRPNLWKETLKKPLQNAKETETSKGTITHSIRVWAKLCLSADWRTHLFPSRFHCVVWESALPRENLCWELCSNVFSWIFRSRRIDVLSL